MATESIQAKNEDECNCCDRSTPCGEIFCDCCGKSWRNDMPGSETCNCGCSNCCEALRDCRYSCFEKSEDVSDCEAKVIKLCKNEDCSPTEDDEHTEKCSLCDGYFADDGCNDCYNLDENDEEGWCSLFGKHSDQANLVKMKGTGEVLCVGGCDASDDEESDEDESEDESEDE